MRPTPSIRFILLSVVCLVLAVAVALQSVGIAFTRKSPETAATLFPLNGLAKENAAFDIFSSLVEAGDKPKVAALVAEERARDSYQLEPLTPEAHAILALAQEQSTQLSEVIDAASRLNRRNKTLQALVLEQQVSVRDYSGVLETLDQILRVRPSRSQDLYPVLLTVFAQEGAVEELEELVDGTSPWHRKFLTFAVKQPDALLNLAQLRARTNLDDQEFDEALLRGLAREGKIEVAYSLYQKFKDEAGGEVREGSLTWDATYDPFDWELTDGAEFRAQQSLDSPDLEIYVRPGHGGVFARRIIEAPDPPISVSAELHINSNATTGQVGLKLKCTQARQPFYEAQIEDSELRFNIEELPPGCRFIEISLFARAWSGESAIRGTISPLRIE